MIGIEPDQAIVCARRWLDESSACVRFAPYAPYHRTRLKMIKLTSALVPSLELGADEFMSRLETFLSIGIDDFVETPRFAVPDAEDRNLRAVARSVRRLVLAGLLDRSITQKELEEELRALVSGVPVGRVQLLTSSSSARR